MSEKVSGTSRADVVQSVNKFIVETLRDEATKNSPEMVVAIAELFHATEMY